MKIKKYCVVLLWENKKREETEKRDQEEREERSGAYFCATATTNGYDNDQISDGDQI